MGSWFCVRSMKLVVQYQPASTRMRKGCSGVNTLDSVSASQSLEPIWPVEKLSLFTLLVSRR